MASLLLDTLGAPPEAQYNTQLSAQEQSRFLAWANEQKRLTGRDFLRDLHDYDMQGWWKANQNKKTPAGHFEDTFKKPNHPTFSSESKYSGKNGLQGGDWVQLDKGKYAFAAGPTNLQYHKPEELQSYFSEVEPGNVLVLPSEAAQ